MLNYSDFIFLPLLKTLKILPHMTRIELLNFLMSLIAMEDFFLEYHLILVDQNCSFPNQKLLLNINRIQFLIYNKLNFYIKIYLKNLNCTQL